MLNRRVFVKGLSALGVSCLGHRYALGLPFFSDRTKLERLVNSDKHVAIVSTEASGELFVKSFVRDTLSAHDVPFQNVGSFFNFSESPKVYEKVYQNGMDVKKRQRGKEPLKSDRVISYELNRGQVIEKFITAASWDYHNEIEKRIEITKKVDSRLIMTFATCDETSRNNRILELLNRDFIVILIDPRTDIETHIQHIAGLQKLGIYISKYNDDAPKKFKVTASEYEKAKKTVAINRKNYDHVKSKLNADSLEILSKHTTTQLANWRYHEAHLLDQPIRNVDLSNFNENNRVYGTTA